MTKGEGVLNVVKIVSSINGVGRSGQLCAKKYESRSPTYIIYKNKFKVDKDLNICHDTIKIIKENTGRKISNISHSNIFTDMSPRARDTKERINKWDLIKMKSFCMAKKTV